MGQGSLVGGQMWYGKPGALARAEAATKPGKKQREHEPPGCKVMTERLSAAIPDVATFYQKAYQSWRLMCKGAHPSAEGTTQTHTEDEGRFDFGATYDEDLFLVGFDNGIFAAMNLLKVLGGVRSQTAEWARDLQTLDGHVSAWRASLREERLAS